MSEKCENTPKCGFFLNYKDHPEVIRKKWIENYCNDIEKSEKCERKILKKRTGEKLPDKMTPTGETL